MKWKAWLNGTEEEEEDKEEEGLKDWEDSLKQRTLFKEWKEGKKKNLSTRRTSRKDSLTSI